MTKRYVTAAAAALACLLPAACDAAAASPVFHNDSYNGGSSGHSTAHPASRHASPPGRHRGGAKTTTAAADATTDPADATTDPADATTDPAATDDATATTDPAATVTETATNDPTNGNNGLDVLARDCSKSNLPPHTGFQVAPACVSTAFGEVAAADKDPSLLITDAPTKVAADTPFVIKVSTRNLVRDRFLGAAAGGYYLESSVLTSDGIQRGHFHTACRILSSGTTAPDPNQVPAFFVATQDNGGGAAPDTVSVQVPGLPAGNAQCTVWAGDGSHRVPMMQRANQTPAIDSVRITVS